MLVDEIKIRITAGNGGAGKYAPVKAFKSAHIAGDGGRGGDVYATATSDLSALNQYVGITELKAEDGTRGGDNDSTGKRGKNLYLTVPVGTSINDIEFDTVGVEKLICKGGLGGKGGNFRAQSGLPGESIDAKIILKLIAKYGFIGLPNAGKSSLLNALTNSNAVVGAYPFTTLEPNLGVLDGQIIADIPGLIEGASQGKGLGIKFLKHIEKVSLLFHCISCESSDIARDYQIIVGELKNDKPQVIVLTKTDLVTPEVVKRHKQTLSKFKLQMIAISIHDLKSLEMLKNCINKPLGVSWP